jgi:hypothetical protein
MEDRVDTVDNDNKDDDDEVGENAGADKNDTAGKNDELVGMMKREIMLFLDFQDSIPKETVSYGYLLVQRKYTGVRNVLLDSYDDSMETLIVFTFQSIKRATFW